MPLISLGVVISPFLVRPDHIARKGIGCGITREYNIKLIRSIENTKFILWYGRATDGLDSLGTPSPKILVTQNSSCITNSVGKDSLGALSPIPGTGRGN